MGDADIGNICFGMQVIIFPIMCERVYIITLGQMFCNFKPLHVQMNPWVWEQIINARLLCFQSHCFSKLFDSLLHALILNLFGVFFFSFAWRGIVLCLHSGVNEYA